MRRVPIRCKARKCGWRGSRKAHHVVVHEWGPGNFPVRYSRRSCTYEPCPRCRGKVERTHGQVKR